MVTNTIGRIMQLNGAILRLL